ncbi:MAG: homoserine O-acetyltransferase [Proteobacteria bacterium]|nr:homoserine O-acetyltransferase [Pseudomonadota bacterium]
MDEYSKQEQGRGASVGAVHPQLAKFDTPFTTVSGAVLPQWELCFETYGSLNAERSNAVLVCHALSGSQHAAGVQHDNPNNVGWWDNIIGPGKPLDTDRFFIVSSNNLGGCHGSTGPTHPHPEDGKAYGSRFPVMTVEDWVHSQKKLAEQLGIDRFAAIVGGSLGGMQALRWAIDYPEAIGAAVIIAASARLTALNIAFNDIARSAIIGDANFYDGNFYQHNALPTSGLQVARMLGHVTYLTDFLMGKKFGRTTHANSDRNNSQAVQFEVESYLRYQGTKFSTRFDANTYLLMTRALDYFDPAADCNGDLVKALAPATAQFLLLSFSSDWRFPPEHSRHIVQALLAGNKNVSYLEIEADTGHDSFLLTNAQYHNAIATFMNHLTLDAPNKCNA